jgi:hypothetical protein
MNKGPWFDPTINRWVSPVVVPVRREAPSDPTTAQLEAVIEELRAEVRQLAALVQALTEQGT